MTRKLLSVATVALAAIVLATAVIFGGSPARAATYTEIEEAVTKGLAWLDDQQQPGGYFESGNRAAATCLALVKFEDRGWEQHPAASGGDGPFDSGYDYNQTVVDALDYAFSQMVIDADPGVHFGGGQDVYLTGICMMAVAGSREPSRVVSVPGPINGWTYEQVLQGMLDWMEYAQNAPSDPGPPAACSWGGWGYTANDPGTCDNSNSGYATLGIGFAIDPTYGFGLTMSPSVETNLNTFVNNVQNPADGCSYYRPCGPWVMPNILKQGNLLYEMALLDRPVDNATVVAAKGCMENYWYQPPEAGWQGGPGQGYYQAMFTMMKGLEGYGIPTLDGGIGDWFGDVSTYIYNDKVDAGSGKWYWTGVGFGQGDLVLETSWALLTLEKAVTIVAKANKYCIEGTSTGVGWGWTLTDPTVSLSRTVPNETVAVGGAADLIAAAWVKSINDEAAAQSVNVTATQFKGGVKNCFKITPKGLTLTVDSCTVTNNPSGCSFNPAVIDVTDVGVGGIVELAVGGSDAPASAAAGSGSSSPPYAAIAGAAAAAAVAFAASGWYARRRWMR